MSAADRFDGVVSIDVERQPNGTCATCRKTSEARFGPEGDECCICGMRSFEKGGWS